ncbi:hypothetical protein CDAR_28721 [Caerostris darwini]|uniref:Uncharacterized protein n=1 Tax=Caerostris darwini TaxID=1538125 RepID=A0AAV4Q7U3_9ARAC|nr:hypothetical protein CDAR_28721 [Caerostris darwini]
MLRIPTSTFVLGNSPLRQGLIDRGWHTWAALLRSHAAAPQIGRKSMRDGSREDLGKEIAFFDYLLRNTSSKWRPKCMKRNPSFSLSLSFGFVE